MSRRGAGKGWLAGCAGCWWVARGWSQSLGAGQEGVVAGKWVAAGSCWWAAQGDNTERELSPEPLGATGCVAGPYFHPGPTARFHPIGHPHDC